MVEIFLRLLMGHAVADFGLQSDWVAINKNRHLNKTPVNWWYVMAAHALIHGAMVTIVTGNAGLGLTETVCHFLIDCGKCETWYGIHVDQFLHVVCKLAWCLVLAFWHK